jgi:hypothetical protein
MVGAFLYGNLSPTEKAKAMRHMRVQRNLWGKGKDDTREFVSVKQITDLFEKRRQTREEECGNYLAFRRIIDLYNPRVHHDGYTGVKHVEWDMYLKPETFFDQECQKIFDMHHDTGFKMVVIRHRRPHPGDPDRLKRIEGKTAAGKVEILWTDAS